jgi:hypothetical protein
MAKWGPCVLSCPVFSVTFKDNCALRLPRPQSAASSIRQCAYVGRFWFLFAVHVVASLHVSLPGACTASTVALHANTSGPPLPLDPTAGGQYASCALVIISALFAIMRLLLIVLALTGSSASIRAPARRGQQKQSDLIASKKVEPKPECQCLQHGHTSCAPPSDPTSHKVR